MKLLVVAVIAAFAAALSKRLSTLHVVAVSRLLWHQAIKTFEREANQTLVYSQAIKALSCAFPNTKPRKLDENITQILIAKR